MRRSCDHLTAFQFPLFSGTHSPTDPELPFLSARPAPLCRIAKNFGSVVIFFLSYTTHYNRTGPVLNDIYVTCRRISDYFPPPGRPSFLRTRSPRCPPLLRLTIYSNLVFFRHVDLLPLLAIDTHFVSKAITKPDALLVLSYSF